jgi:aminoglycoside 2'-N-acetyltransferase I
LADVRVLTTDEARPELLTEIRALLDDAFAGDFSDDDWDHARGGWHVVVAEDGEIVAHASVIARGLEVGDRPVATGYIEAVAVAPARQRQGLGSIAMETVAELVRRRFEMGALSTGSPAFYERLGWRVWRGPTHVRRGATATPTPQEDGGVMVLRFGPSADADLTAPITCEARTGEDW